MMRNWTAIALVSAALAGCGGGGSPAAQGGPTDKGGLTPPLAEEVLLSAGTQVGRDTWADGSPSVECYEATPTSYHAMVHVSILLNGEALALPAHIGIDDCAGRIHTKDRSGLLHLQGEEKHYYTLGELFRTWGQPFDGSHVAGFDHQALNVYVIDSQGPRLLQGDPRELVLTPNLRLVLALGSLPQTLPNYRW